MSTTKHQVTSIVIVGGGTSGWMTAAALSHHLKRHDLAITLIDSSEIGTIGVGEATIPTLRRFYQQLGFSDQDVMQATNATCKLGIEFKDWYQLNSSFIHPFGLFGQNVNNVPFHHYWLKLRQQGDKTPLSHYSLGVQLAQHDKFFPPFAKPKNQLQIFDWALHFDAALFANLMREFSLKNQVRHIDRKITDIQCSTLNGNISSLILEDGNEIEADLFIDCSGFNALLIDKTLKCGYQDWSQWLLCDRAVAVQSESIGEPAPRTIVKAHEAGWQWTIPLQHRQGNGHVYSSRFTTDEAATQRLLDNVDGKLLTPTRTFRFTPGRRDQAWLKNCIAVGLSSGFLEPLESTSIALVETAIDKIVQSLAQPFYNEAKVNRFNEVTRLEYERVRDFIILHYKATAREDSAMWRYCSAMDIPPSLQEKINKFKQNGELVRYPWEIFGPDSWLAIYDGFGLRAQRYLTSVDNVPSEQVLHGLKQMKSEITHYRKNAPTHSQFLAQHFGFEPRMTE